MGFCEMVYHETAKFPASEKDGLAKELRSISMLLLRTITRDSIKAQKEFLAALDKTVDIQLDLLILLKLAFRMGFIEQRVYQTMEEDLKGLENIANEMKGIHGITISDESIFTRFANDGAKEKKPSRNPVNNIPLPGKKEKTKPEKMQSRQGGPPPRRGRSQKPKPGRVNPKVESKKPERINSQVESKKQTKPHVTGNPSDFAGTPLYDEDDPSNHKLEESKVKLPRKDDAAGSRDVEKSQKRKPTKGRWSLKRSVSKRSPSGSKTDKKE